MRMGAQRLKLQTEFTKIAMVGAAMMLLAFSSVPTDARDKVTIGISAPLTGYFSILGEQIEAGARYGVDSAQNVGLTVLDDECGAEGGARTANRLVEAKVSFAIGYPCIEALDAAMPVLAKARIPLIVVGVRAEGLKQENDDDWLFLRLASRTADEATAAADYLKRAWRTVNFAIIDDGTLYGRQLAEAVRFILEEASLKPVFADTYRPQLENQFGLVRRLKRAGATAAFIGGDAFDAAVISANANDIDVPLTLAGGNALIAPPSDGRLADGTIVTALPEWITLEAAAKLAAKIEPGTASDGYFVPAHAAAEIALTILGMDEISDPTGTVFNTAMGPITFDANGDLTRNLFGVFVIRDGKPVPADQGEKTGAVR
jgi:branched-chain amino acid transport system substrate-binding protein